MSNFDIHHFDVEDVNVRDYGGDMIAIDFGERGNEVTHFVEDLEEVISMAEKMRDKALALQAEREKQEV